MGIFVNMGGLFSDPTGDIGKGDTGKHNGKGPSKTDKSGPATGKHHAGGKVTRTSGANARGGDDADTIKPWWK